MEISAKLLSGIAEKAFNNALHRSIHLLKMQLTKYNDRDVH